MIRSLALTAAAPAHRLAATPVTRSVPLALRPLICAPRWASTAPTSTVTTTSTPTAAGTNPASTAATSPASTATENIAAAATTPSTASPSPASTDAAATTTMPPKPTNELELSDAEQAALDAERKAATDAQFHGSHHWVYERALSVALLPTIGYAMVVGADPINDMILASTLVAHMHLGLDQVVTDYVPVRRYPRGGKAANWALRGLTMLVLYGCWRINTQDVGMAESFRRVWRARDEREVVEA
ncbi:membrane anchor subunit of succinate dehydrogenase, Sdh4 [Allomyces arbusculus]|nr:membrane anchor subunit of succinate dehydrogenase, Sdh4 [Allomyces arbusculus]